ncbi:MAG: tryptophan--tRNA ligase [Candidatus Omnitrophica bacterium]|nr:tryptophan--tRNA ligase [Candidatus Omnitrophota bacterium]
MSATGKKRILSGMRPTGKLHLGHLVGALSNWKRLQETHACFFMIADWHALMSEYKNAAALREYITDNVIDWISCGIDPEKSVIFVQSQIPEHLELCMVFSCLTPLGWLERCPTYKEQLRELATREINTYAFLGYPVLQAADILLYRADVVPVGEDQLPHVELTREIAQRFQHVFGKEIFPQPQAELTKTSRLLGLDGRKMSKSYNNAIGLSDAPDLIKQKVMQMITDPQRIRRTDPGRPEICNVHSYYQAFAAPEIAAEIAQACRQAAIGCTDCKRRMGELLCSYLAPVQQRRAELLHNREKLDAILADGRARAQRVAAETMRDVRALAGI